jgi:hypothetical protein
LDSRALLSSGVLGDFTEKDPLRFGLVNLQVGLYPLLHDRHLTNVAANACGMVLALILLFLVLRTRVDDDLLLLSALAVLSLVPVYHRFYDAALLVIPLTWFVRDAGQLGKIPMTLGLLSIAVFLIPGGTLLQTLGQSRIMPSMVLNNDFLYSLVMAHEVWFLLLLELILLYELGRSQRFGELASTSARKKVMLPAT